MSGVLPFTGYVEVTQALNKGERDNPHGGVLVKWNVNFKDDDGHAWSNVYWQRKPENEVSVGDRVYGMVSEGDYGPRFKVLQAPDSPGPHIENPQQGSTGEARVPGAAVNADSGGEYFDKRSARIERQHSQEMAIRYLDLLTRNELIPDRKVDDGYLTDVIDFFVADLDHASPKTGSPPAAAHAPPTPATGGVTSDSGAKPSAADQPPPKPDTAESVQADATKLNNPDRPVTSTQKGKVTKALNASPIADGPNGVHNQLRAAFGADKVQGAWDLIQAVERVTHENVPEFLRSHGITPASEAVDLEGLPTVDDELARLGVSAEDSA